MDDLTFLSEQLFTTPPRIEAPLEGLWRLEESQCIDQTNQCDFSYTYKPDCPKSFWLDVRSCDSAFYNNCYQCPDIASRCCPTCYTRDYLPYTFDPQQGMFICRDVYCFVRELTAAKMIMFELGKFGQGVITHSLYRRIG